MSAPTREDARALRDKLAPLQEARGYWFNPDAAFTEDLLEQLLVTKGRYGYMACPCRLASGTRENDRDIICPCVYRTEDVAEYGTCFCGLYVDAARRESGVAGIVVPERRPPEKIVF